MGPIRSPQININRQFESRPRGGSAVRGGAAPRLSRGAHVSAALPGVRDLVTAQQLTHTHKREPGSLLVNTERSGVTLTTARLAFPASYQTRRRCQDCGRETGPGVGGPRSHQDARGLCLCIWPWRSRAAQGPARAVAGKAGGDRRVPRHRESRGPWPPRLSVQRRVRPLSFLPRS